MGKKQRRLTEEEQKLLKMRLENKLCIHCIHRKRFKRGNDTCNFQIACELQPSRQSLSGFKTIKAHDFACGLYKQTM